jgi:LysM repeat protein
MKRNQSLYTVIWNKESSSLSMKVLLLIVLMLSCYACQKTDYPEEVDAIEARVTTIEQRIAQLEKMEQRITAYEFQIRELRESILRLADMVAKTPEAALTKRDQPPSRTKEEYYLVQPGDSLYGVAQKYGFTVEELRRLNNLKKGQPIHPGQKLLVNPKHAQ